MSGQKLGQILEKPSVPSRSYIFNLMFMKRDQNVCLDEISDKFENGSCTVKTRSLGQFIKELVLVNKGL